MARVCECGSALVNGKCPTCHPLRGSAQRVISANTRARRRERVEVRIGLDLRTVRRKKGGRK